MTAVHKAALFTLNIHICEKLINTSLPLLIEILPGSSILNKFNMTQEAGEGEKGQIGEKEWEKLKPVRKKRQRERKRRDGEKKEQEESERKSKHLGARLQVAGWRKYDSSADMTDGWLYAELIWANKENKAYRIAQANSTWANWDSMIKTVG